MKKFLCLAAIPLGLGIAAPAEAAQNPIGVLRAVERAERAVKGQVVEVDLDRRAGGRLVYEIDVADGRAVREIEIDAYTGNVIANSRRLLAGWLWPIYDKALPRVANARPLSTILRDLENRTGGKVIDVDFEVESGQPRYEVDLSTQAGIASMYLDPQTGQRLAFVVDD